MRNIIIVFFVGCCLLAKLAYADVADVLELGTVIQNGSRQGVRIGDPIWVILKITNPSKEAVAITLEGSRDHDISVSSDTKLAVISKVVGVLDKTYTQITVAPGKSFDTEILLNDYVIPDEEGEHRFRVRLPVYKSPYDRWEPATLQTNFAVHVRGRIDENSVAEFVESRKDRFHKEPKQREKIIRELGTLEPKLRPVDLLAEAIQDDNVRVAVAAINALRDVRTPAAVAAIKAGRNSKHEVIRVASDALARAYETAH